MEVGQRIKTCRKKRGLSVNELAEKLEKNRATVYRYENGDIENLPINILEPIAKALDTSPAYLMGWTQSCPPIAEKNANEAFIPTKHELDVIMAYRNQPSMQTAVDRILGVHTKPSIHLQGKVAARGFQETDICGTTSLTAEEIKKRLGEAVKDIDF
ncbi:helix-turn-helix domain protein [Anaerotignum neopropionicum]|uniref:Helix-turn-helix domain protein n=1 Tax=Anaerotignum neopropionicum TaxID=36847 RepID=A0A136WE02_9FIRM|nr:helix-turn-helix transcriptional regulator [Anaerotignum neopropionicum]KXL52703.1 helix-turn-helix domain protein [Anaerotignum neopropionicum]